LGLHGGVWSDSGPFRFTPGVRAPDNPWSGDWWAPGLVWMWWQREKIPAVYLLELNPGRLARSLVSILTELPRL